MNDPFLKDIQQALLESLETEQEPYGFWDVDENGEGYWNG